MRHVIVGTAGHIDHGKSALVLALTGTDPDRWEEEKRRGITIDLGFAHLDLGEDLRIGFIDVPGHERFVKNMLAGVGGIDILMLVIAGDESIKPQTREHFDICKLLGIRRGLVVITKSDLVEREMLDLVRLEVQEFVAGSFLAGAPMIAVSARTGEGLDELKKELRRLSMEAPTKPADLPFRLPIDRSFVMKGFGAVVTGTLIAGTVEKEAEVEIFPGGQRARVRGIEVYNAPADRATAGQRTALNLAGMEARQISRGMVLATPGLFQPTTSLDCNLTLLSTARPLKNHAQVHFHCGTAEMLARAVLLEGKEMRPGVTGFVQLRLSEPGLFVPGDRFIIRQFSPVTTIGGGSILDNAPTKHRPGDRAAIEALQVLDRGEPEARIELLAKWAGEATPAALAARTGWKPLGVLSVAKSLESQNRLVLLGQPPSLLVHAAYFAQLAKQLLEYVEKFHAANPLVAGLAKEELRANLGAGGGSHSIPSPTLLNALLQSLAAQGKVNVQGEIVCLGGRSIQLSAEEIVARDQIAGAFEKAGLAVPTAREVLANLRLDRPRAEKLLRILLKDNVLHKVTEDLIFHQSALRMLREILARRKTQNNRLGVTDFKEITGLSRKYAIPLLEYLDRERVTRRVGDERIIL
ncbi:MAG: selenocysteine-specific translation elongation factor [Terriglobia bacterium]